MSKHTPGMDKYGHFVVFNPGTPHEFRSAMPCSEVAAVCAAAHDLYAIVRAEYDAHGGFETLPIGYPAERAAAICAAISKAEGGAK